jgi:hypothetical protein
MVCKDAVRRIGIERCQSRIEAEPRPAIGTEDRVRLGHIDVDVRMVLRWGHAYALEFSHPDADFGKAAVVSELRIAAARHRLRPLHLAGSGPSAAPIRGWVGSVNMPSSLSVAARPPPREDGIQLGDVKRPCILTVPIVTELVGASCVRQVQQIGPWLIHIIATAARMGDGTEDELVHGYRSL